MRSLVALLFTAFLTQIASAQVQFFPPLQPQAPFVIEGSPEGRVFMDVGIMIIDKLSGKLYTKTTTRDVATGWVDQGGVAGGGGTGEALAFTSQFTVTGDTNIAIASGASFTNANLITPALGAASATSVTATNFYIIPVTVAYSTAITVDFAGPGDLWTVLGGNMTLTSSGLAAGRGVNYRIDNQTATNCSVILPSTWRFVSGTTNNILATGKIGLLSLKSYTANDTNVVCLWASE